MTNSKQKIEISFDASLIGPWVFSHVFKSWGPEGRTAIGLVQGNKVLAGIVFEEYTGHGGSVMLHVALDHPNVPIRKLLTTAAAYCFDQLKVQKVIGLVPSYNEEALKFDLKLGFKPEAVIRNVYANGDAVILSMTKQECWFYRPARKAA